MTSVLEGGRGVMKKWTNADRGGGGVEPTRTSMKMTTFNHIASKAEMAVAGKNRSAASP